MKTLFKLLLVTISILTVTAVNAQLRTSTTRNIQQGEYLDLQSSTNGDTLQVSDTVAYIIPITHANRVLPYFTWNWNKSGSGTASITMSFYQGNSPTTFFPVKAGVAQTTYTKSYTLSATGDNEVSFARDTALFEGRYLKVQFLTTSTASVGGKVTTRVKTAVQ
jgi:hypothetical protein